MSRATRVAVMVTLLITLSSSSGRWLNASITLTAGKVLRIQHLARLPVACSSETAGIYGIEAPLGAVRSGTPLPAPRRRLVQRYFNHVCSPCLLLYGLCAQRRSQASRSRSLRARLAWPGVGD